MAATKIFRGSIADVPAYLLAHKVIDLNTGCWLWTRTKSSDKMGYRKLCVDGHRQPVHRWSYEVFIGPIPDNLLIRHSCNNPLCINPEHLLPGTHKDNFEDAVRAGTHIVCNPLRGERHPNTKLTAADIREIRSLLARGLSSVEVAKQFNSSYQCIWQIKNGKRWAAGAAGAAK